MKKNNLFVPIIVLQLTLDIIPVVLSGQSRNGYQFIEPNISISFDSSSYTMMNYYSNTYFNSEGWAFIKSDDTLHHIRITISAGYSNLKPKRQVQNNIVQQRKQYIKILPNDTATIVSMEKRSIDGFSCTGVVALNNISEKYATLIKGFKLFNGGYCELIYVSVGRNDLQKEFKIVTSFLAGFKSYTQKQIRDQDDMIKHKYTIEVDTGDARSISSSDRRATFAGIVKVKQSLEHKVAGVKLDLDDGQEVFSPDENGEVRIVTFDPAKGKVTKRGEFIIFNSFGKKVSLPFSFSYTSNGAN